MLLELNRPDKALEAFEANLKSHPNRFNGLYRAALAAQQTGDKKKATLYFDRLLKCGKSTSKRVELVKAREFLAMN
jgi:tetratricopeptide (TPR) repeat protein